MDKILSEKIKVLSFLCTVMVVFRHGLNLQAFGLSVYGTSYVAFIENGVSKLTEVAVPYFFIVSGYFFFRHAYYGKGEYAVMLRKKIRTLFVPFLFWNIVGIIPLMLMGQFVFEETPWRYAFQLLNSDWNGVLWYIRDIMTFMLLVPLYAWIFVLNNRWLYIAVFVLLFMNWLPVDCGWMSSEGMLFFFLGGMLQKNDVLLGKRMPVAVFASIGVVWIISCFFFPFYWPIHRYNTLLGLAVLWQLFHYLPKKSISWMLSVSVYSFFIYVMHAFIVRGMKVGVAHFFFGNDVAALLSYIMLPLITVGIALYAGKVFNKYLPTFFSIVMGGRG